MEDVIWADTVDNGAWEAKVVGTSDRAGELTVTESATGQVVHRETVGLSYGAVFGPDVADLSQWQDTVINVIDNPSDRRV